MYSRYRLGAVLAFAACLLAAGFEGRAGAADPAGFTISVSGSSAQPSVTLHNGSPTACRVAVSAQDAVHLVSVSSGGQAVQATSALATVEDPTVRLATLTPGMSRTVPLTTVRDSAGRTYLASDDESTAQLYEYDATRPLSVSVAYTPPLVTPSAIPLCVGATSNGIAAAHSTASEDTAWRPAVIAAGASLLLVVVLLVFLLRRRRRREALTLLTILALAATFGVRQTRASADITPDAGSRAAYTACLSSFKGPGGDPAGILPTLLANGVTVAINYTRTGENGEYYLGKSLGSLITWNVNDTHAYTGGGNAEKCSSLYHELYHAYEDNHGGEDTRDCFTAGPGGTLVDSGVKINEVNATRAQNQYRTSHGMPARTTYGDTPLPSGPCQPPPAPKPANPPQGKPTASTNGDPHLFTYDGRSYDFQAAGEFVASRDPAGGFEIQVRQQAFPGLNDVAVNTAVAMDVAGDDVEVALSDGTAALYVDKTAHPLADSVLTHGGRVSIEQGLRGPEVLVTWPDGSVARVSSVGKWGLVLRVRPATAHAGHLQGLLGDFDGNPSNDVRTEQGALIDPSFASLYPGFADGWRISQAQSLFHYDPGTSTNTFTDRAFPHAEATPVEDVTARAVCTAAGVLDPIQLINCTTDVALTGQADFATGYVAAFGSSVEPGAPSTTLVPDGASVTARISAPGEVVSYSVHVDAPRAVYIDLSGSTFPSQCGLVDITDVSGVTLNVGCVSGGHGDVDHTELPAAGTYIVRVDSGGAATGVITLRMITDLDQTARLSVGGPAVTATIAQPGAQSRFTVHATAGQRLTLTATGSTFANQCGLLELQRPDRVAETLVCVLDGTGTDTTEPLTLSGDYTLIVDTDDAETGHVTVRVTD